LLPHVGPDVKIRTTYRIILVTVLKTEKDANQEKYIVVDFIGRNNATYIIHDGPKMRPLLWLLTHK